MKKRLIFLLLFQSVCGPVVPSASAIEALDLGQPESVALDPGTGAYFISNINGSPAEKDNNGYISKVSPDGLVTVVKFIESKGKDFQLHAPKGLVVVGRFLYAVDIDGIKVFETETGAFARFIDFAAQNPQFLNDIVADRSGNLYVSDMLADRIYRCDPAKPDGGIAIYKESPLLGQPNGLLVNPQTRGLMVAAWGTGRLMEIDHNGHIMSLKKDLGNLDGLAADAQGTLYVSNYKGGEIYKIPRWGRGPLSLFQSGLVTPADVSFDDSRGELVVPLMNQNRVTSFKASDPQITRRPVPRGPGPRGQG